MAGSLHVKRLGIRAATLDTIDSSRYALVRHLEFASWGFAVNNSRGETADMERIANEMDLVTAGQEDKVITKPFEISVNRKPVEVAGPIVTGLEIKEASIQQGLPIEVSFQLALVEPDGKERIIGNVDKVDVRESKTFFATADDDNS